MGEYIDLMSLASDIAQAGYEEVKEFSDEERATELVKFNLLRNDLEKCYANTAFSFSDNSKDTIESRRSVLQALRDSTFPSGKGGADLFFLDNFNQKVQKSYTNLTEARKDVYALKNDQDFKMLSLKIMKEVYAFKKRITGINEYFSFVYKGESGFARVIMVPVDEFLGNQQLLDNALTLQTDFGGGIGNPYKLRFNYTNNTMKNSILSQISNLQGAKDVAIGNITLEDSKGRLFSGEAFQTYKAFKKENTQRLRVGFSDLSTSRQERILQKDNGAVLRTDARYLVIRKQFESGFLGQALVEAGVSAYRAATYNKDQVSWFGGEDVNFGSLGISVKSFLESAPTLMSITSLHDVLNRIVYSLTTGKDIEGIKSFLSQNFESALAEMDGAANSDLGSVFQLVGL